MKKLLFSLLTLVASGFTAGADPQLDSAIQLMLQEIKNAKVTPQPRTP